MYNAFPLAALALFAAAADLPPGAPEAAAGGAKSCHLWGQIAGAAGRLQEGLDVELTGSEKSANQRAHATASGNFELRAVPPGEYQFRIVDRSGKVLHQQTQWLGDKPESVLLLVPDQQAELAGKFAVSFVELQRRTPTRAWKAFREAHKAGAEGDLTRCIQRLEEALSIDPDFAEAHSDLAAILARVGRTEEALGHAQTAYRLNPRLPQAGANFALLLASLKKYPEAEITARHMLNASYYAPELRGVLAISLIGQKRNLGEALKVLDESAVEIPFVRLLAARALVESGETRLGLDQVTTYLRSAANACEKPGLETWVNSVQSRLGLE
jgi:tetratricopeptide (TPR) repeat protein